ncbi:hypothetical protein GCM10011505_08260 [Tistrella bauzanensis]|uniref:TIGR02444 family protein n=1 Tax=Tistrella bauzanensis TaxID=657419 RepID=A0ABQ1IC02_9PROT|nr:TIGR02444 family protein [Tistrella bauzanensis]GGB29233.1 hypothetical protein GCM10011505_08260 [Tistrella bauzanensis]
MPSPATDLTAPRTPIAAHAHAVYARPCAAPVCLAVQDRFGADVPLILMLHHAAATGRQLDRHGVAALDDALAGWRAQVVRPLRTLRRQLRGPAPAGGAVDAGRARAIGDHLLVAEIAAETALLDAIGPTLNTLARPAEGCQGRASFAGMLQIYGRLLAAPQADWTDATDRLLACLGPLIDRAPEEDQA